MERRESSGLCHKNAKAEKLRVSRKIEKCVQCNAIQSQRPLTNPLLYLHETFGPLCLLM